MTVHSTPLDAQVFQSLHRSGEDGLPAAHHKRTLDEFRVGGHDADEFVVGEVLAGNQLLVPLFFRAYRVLRLQSASAQDLLQFNCGERVLQVIHVLDILVGQETPDLAAGASGGLFVNDNLVFHVRECSSARVWSETSACDMLLGFVEAWRERKANPVSPSSFGNHGKRAG